MEQAFGDEKEMNIVSVSGGKDSTAMLLMMIEHKVPIHRIYFADTGLELPETYEFIERLSKYCEEELGFGIRILKDEKDWDYYFYKIVGGKIRAGEIRGFPYVIQKCWYQRDCKERLLNKFTDKNDISFIGFAFDELKRVPKKFRYNKQCFPLIEWGMTEQDCMDYCKEKGFINPLYEKYGFKRIGCWLCPKQPKKDLIIIKKYYPELWSKLLKYEKDSPHGFKPNFKLKELEKRLGDKK